MPPVDDTARLTPADADLLRADLAGWTIDSVAELLPERATRALEREQVTDARLVASAAGSAPVALLTRLFMLGDTLSRAELDAALPRFGAEGARRVGLIAASGEGRDDAVRAAIDLTPYAMGDDAGDAHWWIAADVGESVTDAPLRADHVMGVGRASVTLASVTVRRPVARALDIGTGGGIQALHASRHARAVVATDISRRALEYARFNELLNLGGPGAASAPRVPWDIRQGSLLDPISDDIARGDGYDLIVTNPPFVVSPAGAPQYDYRDGGMPGDGVVQALVSGLGAALAPGGTAHMLANWEIHGDAWAERLMGWLDASAAAGVPLDAWVIQRDLQDAAEYAETWLRDGGMTAERAPWEYRAAYEAWLRDFDARGVDAVGLGIITLRRPESGRASLRRFEEHEGPMQQPLGGHIADVLAAHDWLAGVSDEELMGARLTVSADVTEERYQRPGAAGPEHIILRQGGGLRRAIHSDPALAGLVGACDGELSVGQLVHALASLFEVPAGELTVGLLPAVRSLVLDGFLRRA